MDLIQIGICTQGGGPGQRHGVHIADSARINGDLGRGTTDLDFQGLTGRGTRTNVQDHIDAHGGGRADAHGTREGGRAVRRTETVRVG